LVNPKVLAFLREPPLLPPWPPESTGR